MRVGKKGFSTAAQNPPTFEFAHLDLVFLLGKNASLSAEITKCTTILNYKKRILKLRMLRAAHACASRMHMREALFYFSIIA